MAFPLTAIGNETIKPSFIKNISVDMTDANANISSNLAFNCSMGQGSSVPPVSNCATFDYGAVGGIPTSMGGTMLIIGGVQGTNYAGNLPASITATFPFKGSALSCGTFVDTGTTGTGTSSAYTSCGTGVYALGVDTLPASTFETNPELMPGFAGTAGPSGPVSTWANLSGTAGYSGPSGSAGAAAAYDPGLQQALLFGGAAPLAGMGSNAPGVTTYDTWVFDIKNQAWSYLTSNTYVATKLMTLYDTTIDIESNAGTVMSANTISQQIQKTVGARAIFGYVATPGMALTLDETSLAGTVTNTMSTAFIDAYHPFGMIDPTDRLMVIGGYGAQGAFHGSHRINPTYGPDIENVFNSTTPIQNDVESGATLSGFEHAGSMDR